MTLQLQPFKALDLQKNEYILPDDGLMVICHGTIRTKITSGSLRLHPHHHFQRLG